VAGLWLVPKPPSRWSRATPPPTLPNRRTADTVPDAGSRSRCRRHRPVGGGLCGPPEPPPWPD